MSQSPTFINAGVLERLKSGSFVPIRKYKHVRQGGERRNALSPLAVTRRCIRYEPLVFSQRRDVILQMAEALNTPTTKILLIGGPQGIGKTSLIRGLVELMGSTANEASKNPQLLWFEVNRHTDFEEIIQFLIQYIPELCDQERNTPFSPDRRMDRSRPGTPSSGEDPLKRLESGLSSVQDMPLLLVLDNVEYIVDANLRLNSPPFKELLNLLLARPNIKMVLSGERLPYADMSPGQESVLSLQLEGLGEQETLACWLKKTSDPGTNIHDPAILESAFPNETESLKALWQKIKGTPWLIKVVDAWHRHTKMDFVTLHRQLKDAENPQEALIRWIEDTLPEGHQRVIQTLAFLRHPVSARALPALTSACFPLQGALPNEATVLEILEHPLIRVLLKISFPPQQVLNHIRNRNAQGSGKYPPWFELYFAAKQTLCRSLPDAEQARIHDALQDFYLKDKAHEAEQRILRIKNRAMLAEAKYHGGLTRQRPELSSKAGPPTSFNSLAYVYRQGSAPRHAPRTTLDDYRNIQIPEEAFLPELADLTEPIDAEPVTSSTSASFTDILANLEEDAESQERAFIQEAREAYLQERLRKETTTHPQSPENISEKADQDLQAVTGHLLTENHAEDEERHIQKKLAAAVAARDADRLARSLLELAQYRLNRGRHEEALQCLDKLAQLKPTSALSAEMHQLYGAVYKASYRHNAAISAISKAIEAFEQQGSKSAQLGKAYQALGEIQAYRKQYADAAKSYQQAIHWHQQAGQNDALPELHFQLAGVMEALGEPDQAIHHYERALSLDTQAENWSAMAASLANLGALHQEMGDTEKAIDCFQRSLACDRKLNDVAGQLSTLEMLSSAHQERGEQAQAERMLQLGLSLAIREKLAFQQARFYTLLGDLAASQAKLSDAIRHYESALSLGGSELSEESQQWLQQMISNYRTQLPSHANPH